MALQALQYLQSPLSANSRIGFVLLNPKEDTNNGLIQRIFQSASLLPSRRAKAIPFLIKILQASGNIIFHILHTHTLLAEMLNSLALVFQCTTACTNFSKCPCSDFPDTFPLSSLNIFQHAQSTIFQFLGFVISAFFNNSQDLVLSQI